jgi:hypothetical protein
MQLDFGNALMLSLTLFAIGALIYFKIQDYREAKKNGLE